MGDLTRGLVEGLVKNLNDFVRVQDLRDKGITKIIAGGSALIRNRFLQEELKRTFTELREFDVNYAESDSALGAAFYFAD
jgi:hypothetical protein